MSRPSIVQLQVLNRNNLLRNNMNNNEVRYPLIHMRDHLFYTAFVRVSLIYSSIFSIRGRKIIEFLLLSLSFLFLVLLIYIHMTFVQTPSNCLSHVQDKWPRDGILRVELLRERLNGKYSLEKSYLKEQKIKELADEDIESSFLYSIGLFDRNEDYRWVMDTMKRSDKLKEKSTNFSESGNDTALALNDTSLFNITIDEQFKNDQDEDSLPTLTWSEDEYIMEFSLEYGFLKLNPNIRKQYNITVLLVTLDPNVDECFGGPINNFILYYFLGYEEVLLASLKLLASKEQYRGYVRNVVTDLEFIFVNALMDRKSYITAGFVMMVFTVSISILLRYSHHQIFVFIVELLHMLEFHSSFNFPAGPLLTVILALVGMEAIMSEFFNDTAIAFNVILIVWMADQFDTICCRSYFTKKHWLRFFYLYHFFFYAYSYRFGHNQLLALSTSWLFIIHSMVYFFHRYELPLLTARNQRPPSPIAPEDNPNNLPGPDPSPDNEANNSSSTTPPDSMSQSDNISPSGNMPQSDSTPHSDNTPQSNSLSGSDISTSISFNIDLVSTNEDGGNSVNNCNLNQQLADNDLSLSNQSRCSQEFTFSAKSFCDSTEYKDFLCSEVGPSVKSHELRSKSKSIESVCDSRVSFLFFIKLIICVVLILTIIFLVKNISISSFLNDFLRYFYCRMVSSKFVSRSRYFQI